MIKYIEQYSCIYDFPQDYHYKRNFENMIATPLLLFEIKAIRIV